FSLVPDRAWLFRFRRARCKTLQIDLRSDNFTHLLLELIDRQSSVEDDKVVGFHHFVVLLEDTGLEETEAFGAVIGEAEIHAGFVVFQLGAAAEDAVNGDVEGRAEVEGDVRDRREAIEVAKPLRGAAARSVAGKRRVDIAVGENEIVALKERHDLTLAAVGEVGRVQERKGGRSKQTALFAAARCGFDEGRGVPLREMEAVAADFEPALEEIELRALAGAVGTFDHDQGTGIGAAGDGLFLSLLEFPFCGFRPGSIGRNQGAKVTGSLQHSKARSGKAEEAPDYRPLCQRNFAGAGSNVHRLKAAPLARRGRLRWGGIFGGFGGSRRCEGA